MNTYWATAVATILTGLAAQVADAAPASIDRASAAAVNCSVGTSLHWSPAYTAPGTWSYVPLTFNETLPGNTGTVNVTRCYILYVPKKNGTANLTGARPLVVLLHGGNDNFLGAIQPQGILSYETGTASSVWITTKDPTTSAAQSLAEEYGIIVAVPNGIDDADTVNGAPDSISPTQHWNDCSGFNPGFDKLPPQNAKSKVAGVTYTSSYKVFQSSNQLALYDDGVHFYQQNGAYTYVDDVLFINNMIGNIPGHLPTGVSINSQMVYAVGASDGGNMALRLARDDSSVFAGVAASLAGDAAQGVRDPNAANGVSFANSTYNGSADSRLATDPPACSATGSPVPVLLIKGAPGPDPSNPTAPYSTYSESGDNFIRFNGGCGDGTGNSEPYSYGCWLPFDSTDPYNPASVNWLKASGPTTLGNWQARNHLTGVSGTTTPIADGNKTDGSVWGDGTSTDSTGQCTDYAPKAGNELEYCEIHRNGHTDPSIAITIGSYEAGIVPGSSSVTLPPFGNENQDFETAVLQWSFLKGHYIDSSHVHH